MYKQVAQKGNERSPEGQQVIKIVLNQKIFQTVKGS